VVRVPSDATNPRLVLARGGGPPRVMIAHENAFFQGKLLFRLAA
jgi:hypothetical protein